MKGPFRRQPSREVITSTDLRDEQLAAEACRVTETLKEMGVEEVVYDCCEGRTRIHINEIVEAVLSDTCSHVFETWSGSYSTIDQTFYIPDQEIAFVFCHEAQVHVLAEDEQLLDQFWARWQSLGYAFGRRRGNEWEWDGAGQHPLQPTSCAGG